MIIKGSQELLLQWSMLEDSFGEAGIGSFAAECVEID